MTRGKKRFGYAVEPLTPEPEKTEVLASPSTSIPTPASVLAISETGNAADALSHPETYALPPQRRGRRLEDGPKRTDFEREQLNVRIRPALKRAAAGIAGLRGLTLGDVVEAALIDYLKRAKNS